MREKAIGVEEDITWFAMMFLSAYRIVQYEEKTHLETELPILEIVHNFIHGKHMK